MKVRSANWALLFGTIVICDFRTVSLRCRFCALQTATKLIPFPPRFVQVLIYRQCSSRRADDRPVVGLGQDPRRERNIMFEIQKYWDGFWRTVLP